MSPLDINVIMDQYAKPNAHSVEIAMKTIWKALSDIIF
jgi:hypothetical protein